MRFRIVQRYMIFVEEASEPMPVSWAKGCISKVERRSSGSDFPADFLVVSNKSLTFATMKVRLSFYLTLSLLAVFLIGCADEVGGVYVVEGYTSTLRSMAHQITSVYFHAGGNWTAKTDVDWLEVSPSSGDGGRNAIAILTKQPNRTKQERTAQVVIESDGKQQVVLITQGNEYALFEKPLYEVADTGGIVDLDFVTNIEKGKLLMSYYQLDWIEMPEKKSESRQEEEWSGKVKTITVRPNHSPVERRAPFILGIYDDSKRFLGLDTTWIRQLPGTDLE